MSPSVLAKPLSVSAIDAKIHDLNAHVHNWTRGLRYEDNPSEYKGRAQPNPLECLALIDELLELRLRLTTAKEAT